MSAIPEGAKQLKNVTLIHGFPLCPECCSRMALWAGFQDDGVAGVGFQCLDCGLVLVMITLPMWAAILIAAAHIGDADTWSSFAKEFNLEEEWKRMGFTQ